MRSPSTPIYLDYNATCLLLPAARAAMLDATDRLWANPSSPHSAGREAARAVDQARRQVAALTDRDPRDVIFTSGATEANALALTGLRTEARPMVWTSAVEHPSALAWADTTLPVDARGVLDLDALADALARSGHRVAVVSVMAANNETGVLQPVAEIAAMVRAAGAVFHCDATQIPGRLPVRLDADLITLSAHKLGGPRGVGALIGRPAPRPLLRGGPQERGARAGTLNTPGIVGFGAAASHVAALPPFDPGPRDALEAAAMRLGATILGSGAPRLPNTLSARFGPPGELVVAALDLEGVAVSTGSACASGASEPSHVLRAMGQEGVPVRFSLGPDTSVEVVVEILEAVLRRMEASCASSLR